jgi:HAD superfamily hydrolase (TIGR01509 family)
LTIRAVIFDMDGLLIDSEPYWERARAGYCASVGCKWKAEDELTVKGHNSAEWATVIKGRCGLAEIVESIIQGVSQRVEALYRERLPLLPGSQEVVRDLASSYPLAIASSSPQEIVEYAMRLAGLLDRFQVVVSADQVGKGKPHPEVFLEAARQLQVPPHEIAVFEDSSAGIEAAVRAGMWTIAVPNAHYPPTEAALARANLVQGRLEDFRPQMLP